MSPLAPDLRNKQLVTEAAHPSPAPSLNFLQISTSDPRLPLSPDPYLDRPYFLSHYSQIILPGSLIISTKQIQLDYAIIASSLTYSPEVPSHRHSFPRNSSLILVADLVPANSNRQI